MIEQKEPLESPWAKLAAFETTGRLIAGLVNEKLVLSSIRLGNHGMRLCLQSANETESSPVAITVGLVEDVTYDVKSGNITPELYPADLILPPVIEDPSGDELLFYNEWQPGAIFRIVGPWFCADKRMIDRIAMELDNSAENQGNFAVCRAI